MVVDVGLQELRDGVVKVVAALVVKTVHFGQRGVEHKPGLLTHVGIILALRLLQFTVGCGMLLKGRLLIN